MKLKTYFSTIAMAMTMVSCVGTGEQGIGIKLENMNDSVAPGTDFYQYACGGWIKNNPLKPEYSRFGSFDAVAETNREQMKELILSLANEKHEKGSVAQKIGDLYTMLMDSTRQNKDGIKPIEADMKKIADVQTREEALRIMVENGLKGSGELWGCGIGADMMDSKNNIVSMGQSGLSMGQKEYYLSDDESFKKIREAFKKHVVKMFQLVGDDQATAERKMKSVMAVETRMAKASKSRVELRDPASNYHKMAYADFKKEFAGYDWDQYFHLNFIDDLQTLDVGQPEAVKEAVAILNETDLQILKDWMQWNLLDGNASVLGDTIFMQNFDFYNRTMSGQQEPLPRWKRSVSTVSGVLGEAVGQMYVEKYFPAENKARMEELVKNLQEALAERIDAQEWMSDSTKAYAKDKLASFYVKIGYPNKWKDYSKLTIDPEKTLYENMQAVREWASKKEVEDKYNKPVDRDEWYMTPQTVNAYYNPTTNEICFPAGILQYPFFDMQADDAFNYGAIGVVIGHEMTHGFDDQGRQFDKEGNFRDWWAAGDGDKFKERAQVMSDFFSNIEVLPGLHGNGELTLGENLADHGGLQVAFTAFQNAQKKATKPLGVVDGFTPEQRFFLAYAGVWAQNITEEAIRDLTARDPHSLGEWRVNGALPHIDAWYDAFGITDKDPLFVPKEKRVTIW
ncbi:MAG: M13 family metallopeptidase [Bacteroidaceae bacterium]|nr:M13 family metallopeptidase [Bacteroidaceae bacterium]